MQSGCACGLCKTSASAQLPRCTTCSKTLDHTHTQQALSVLSKHQQHISCSGHQHLNLQVLWSGIDSAFDAQSSQLNSIVCSQTSVQGGQHSARDQVAGASNGRGHRDGPQRLQRQQSQHSELPFHSTGRMNSSTSAQRAHSNSRSRQAQPSSDAFGSVIATARLVDRRTETAVRPDRQNSGVRFLEPGSSHDTRIESASNSRQHSRQKPRPS